MLCGVWYRRTLLSIPSLLASSTASTAATAELVGGREIGDNVGKSSISDAGFDVVGMTVEGFDVVGATVEVVGGVVGLVDGLAVDGLVDRLAIVGFIDVAIVGFLVDI